MEIVCNGLHAIGEFDGVSNERVVVGGVAAGGPAVVQDDVVIAQVAELIVDNQLGCGGEEGLRD